MAYSSKWEKTPNGYEQEVDVQGITSNSIGTMGLREGATELQAYNAAVARIKITKVYDNKVLLTAAKIRPTVNIPLCFVFGRNINVAKYPGVIGKVSIDTNYIAFDDSLINSGLSSLQQLLEYFQREKINYTDVVDTVHNGDLHANYLPEDNSVWKFNMPLSARMGRYLFKRKINYDDIIDNLTSTDTKKPLSANMGKKLKELIDVNTTSINNINNNITDINSSINKIIQDVAKNKTDIANNATNISNIEKNVTNIQNNIGNTIIKIQSTQPAAVAGKNVVWIKI